VYNIKKRHLFAVNMFTDLPCDIDVSNLFVVGNSIMLLFGLWNDD